MLRDYQQRAINQLYLWFENNKTGNPCLVMPTGSGKSHVVAALCKDALQNWPETRVLMLTHVKELIEQNAEKMLLHWKGAPLGIYSAGIGRRDIGEPITFAGIQSVRNKSDLIGHIDLCIIDEAHLISHKDEGGYRNLLSELKKINPNLRIVGLTATPYRLGHGMITDEPALFTDLIEPVTIEELIAKGYLSKLKSKITQAELKADGVHKRGGEYTEKELQEAVNTEENNSAVIKEVIKLAGERKSWLFFCAGVAHAEAVANELVKSGISAACITGKTSKKTREQLINDFKFGKIKALTNANVLTTGFDYPDIDLIVMMRPTLSPGLYVQMAGRGMRLKPHTDHCLVLDFAGVVRTHGPITKVQSPSKTEGEGKGEAPVKVCDECNEIVHAAVMMCPECGYEFPKPDPAQELKLRNDDIMGYEPIEMKIDSWRWDTHVSRTSGKEMLKVRYYGEVGNPIVTEYFPVTHEGYAGQRAIQTVSSIANSSGTRLIYDLDAFCDQLNNSNAPILISYKMDGKFFKVFNRLWD